MALHAVNYTNSTMAKVNVGIHVVPGDVELRNLVAYNREPFGSTMSNMKQIKVNKVGDGYSIIFGAGIFKSINEYTLMRNIFNILTSNLKNYQINFSISYDYELAEYPGSVVSADEDDLDITDDLFNPEVALLVLRFDDMCKNLSVSDVYNKKTSSIMKYFESYSIQNIIEELQYRYPANDNDSDYDWGDEDDDPVDVLHAALYGRSGGKKKKKKKKTYDSSRIIKAAKSPKRAYRRHGVLVCSNKNAIKKDEKIVKEFLKDFIPGNSEWRKDLRKDLLKRWMKMYVVTTKELKALEKEHRKKRHKKHSKSSIDTERALNFTRNLFNVPVDHWNDPTR